MFIFSVRLAGSPGSGSALCSSKTAESKKEAQTQTLVFVLIMSTEGNIPAFLIGASAAAAGVTQQKPSGFPKAGSGIPSPLVNTSIILQVD